MGSDFEMLRLTQAPSSGIEEAWARGGINPSPLIFTDEEIGRECPSPKFHNMLAVGPRAGLWFSGPRNLFGIYLGLLGEAQVRTLPSGLSAWPSAGLLLTVLPGSVGAEELA